MHRQPLHTFPFGRTVGSSSSLPVTDSVSLGLLRLPLVNEFEWIEIERVAGAATAFFER